jgi:hypothetical protein
MIKKMHELIFEKVNQAAHLAPCTEHSEVKILKTLEGVEVGSIQVYRGDKIKKASFTEFNFMHSLGFTFWACTLAPEEAYNIPRFMTELNLNKEGVLAVDCDLYPRVDLVMDIKSFDRYYAPLDATYLQLLTEKKLEVIPVPNGWTRMIGSPYQVWAKARPDTYDVAYTWVETYLEAWLKIYSEARPVSQALQDMIGKRDSIVRNLAKEREPFKPMIEKIFGIETTDKIFDAISF